MTAKKTKRSRKSGVPEPTCSGACVEGSEENNRLRRLTQELEVQQVELSVQNDELREARKESEKNLLQLSQIFACAPIGYLVLDQEGVVFQVNEAARKTFGVRALEAGQSWLQKRIVPRDRSAYSAFLSTSWEAGKQSEPCELSAVKSCGSVIEIKLSAVMLPRSASPSLLVAVEDVTRRRLWERRLRQSEHALLKAQEKSRAFLAMLSHELRNPLASIRSSVEVLEHATEDAAIRRRCREVIGRQTMHLVKLVDDLLDVTRITHGKIKLNSRRLNMSTLVQQAVDSYQGQYAASKLQLRCNITDDAVWVEADPTRLVQVISNVLCNSQKFTPPGGAVDVTLECVVDRAILRIKDTGIGISADVIDDICEPFFQVEQELDRSSGGLGLGLGMVKSLVALQGGNVEVRSEGRNQGAEVIVSMQRCTASPTTIESAKPKQQKSMRVVVIDDNVDSAESLKEFLTLHGHKVSTANDGVRGIKVLREAKADAVLCDIGLPAKDGYSVAREVRRDDRLKHTYMIALTGYAQTKDRERALDAGFDYFLAKPCGAAEVLKAIQERPNASTGVQYQL